MTIDAVEPEAAWSPPEIDPARMRYRVGTSFAAQFALGHDFPAVLRELVQNEYDAGGDTLEVEFESHSLRIRGTGKVIDKEGWSRLSVMFGTGRVPESDLLIEAKANGIGSKNFGLRSLFLIGDTIHVRSGGWFSSLSLQYGAPEKPTRDPGSVGKRGVEIVVPYRSMPVNGLPAFDQAREEEALNELSSGLAATLTKLAVPGKKKSLERVSVRSDRQNRKLSWIQKARREKSGFRGVEALRRTIELTESAGVKETQSELEFGRSIVLPNEFQGKNIPSYFARPRGRIAIAVSVRTKKGRLLTDRPGRWFYPIGVDTDTTGNAVSVSAPFDMDADRSALLAPSVSSWNKWLIHQAVELTVDLLRNVWYERFGSDAFVVLWPAFQSPANGFGDALRERLRSEALWPTRKRERKPRLSNAAELVLPSEPALDGFLEDARYPSPDLLKNQSTKEILRAVGAKVFGIHSLVRLRCAPSNAVIATKLEKDIANFFYSDYQAALSGIELQLKFAKALDAVERKLSNENRKDLRKTASTLTASGELRPAEELHRVPQEIWNACPLPLRDRLHSDLVDSRVMRQLAKPFNANRWASQLADAIRNGNAVEEDKNALYAFLRMTHGRLPGPLLATLRRTAVIRDLSGDWVLPEEVLMSHTPGAVDFRGVLRFPDPAVEGDRELVRALRLRERIEAEDLVFLAKHVSEHVEYIGRFESLLTTHRRSMNPRTLKELGAIPFMRSSIGSFQTPSKLYVRNALNQAVLEDSVLYYSGTLAAGYAERLGCRVRPEANDILASIDGLVAEGKAPKNVEVLFPEFVAALSRARIPPTTLAEKRVVWTDIGWAKPADTLVAGAPARLPLGSMPRPVGRSSYVITAFEQLGAVRTPQARHWKGFLEWAGKRYAARVTPPDIRALIRSAYAHLGADTASLSEVSRLLLDESGHLHPISEARANKFLINDDPAIAVALIENNSTYSFADLVDSRASRFFTAVGVPSLRSIRSFVRFEPVDTVPCPAAVRASEVIDKLTSQEVPQALTALVNHRIRARSDLDALKTADMAESLSKIRHLVFVREIREHYRVGVESISISARARFDGDSVFLAGLRRQGEVLAELAEVVAKWLPHDNQFDWADAIFRLLSADRVEDMARYLAGRGVAWMPRVEFEDDREESDVDEVTEAVSAALGGLVARVPQLKPETPITSITAGVVATVQPAPFPLPDLSSVTPILLNPSGTHIPATLRSGGGWSGGFGGGSVRNEERDRALGRRGEEIVLELERKRLTDAGMDPEKAVWISAVSPAADHDIQSEDVDGTRLWIEVKAATGTDGRFHWSRAEFDLARRARNQYVLYRVYGVDTVLPVVKAFRDPVALLLNDRLRLYLSELQAEVEGGETEVRSPAGADADPTDA